MREVPRDANGEELITREEWRYLVMELGLLRKKHLTLQREFDQFRREVIVGGLGSK
jgi:hypothetical protein